MRNFNEFFLMSTDDAKRYAVEVLKYFSADDDIVCTEIGDGNINYVFKVYSNKDGRSVVIKQADKLLRSSGRPLDTYRNKIEAAILAMEAKLAPGLVPEVYHYDDTMFALSMEDISEYKNLRKELAEGKMFGHLAEKLSDFVALTLLPTTDLVMDRAEKKKNAAFFTNVELCDITEDLVLTEPYYNYKDRNIIFHGNEEFVEQHLYNDEELHCCVAKLRNDFMNKSQALIHGDLHTGSVFVNEHRIKVIDPEFAFYGPMGYDIGNVIANLFFALFNKLYTDSENAEFIGYCKKTISDFFDLSFKKISEQYDKLVSFQLYKNTDFKKHYIEDIIRDSCGYAGTEIIRRTVGDSKVSDITSVTDTDTRIAMERHLIKLGIGLIKNAANIACGADILEML